MRAPKGIVRPSNRQHVRRCAARAVCGTLLLLGVHAALAQETTEPNEIPCPPRQSAPEPVRLNQLRLGETKVDERTGWAVRLIEARRGQSQPFHDGTTGITVNLALPTLTVRNLRFSGPQTDGYDAPARRFSLCGATYVVTPQWGHPYIGNGIAITVIGGAASRL